MQICSADPFFVGIHTPHPQLQQPTHHNALPTQLRKLSLPKVVMFAERTFDGLSSIDTARPVLFSTSCSFGNIARGAVSIRSGVKKQPCVPLEEAIRVEPLHPVLSLISRISTASFAIPSTWPVLHAVLKVQDMRNTGRMSVRRWSSATG